MSSRGKNMTDCLLDTIERDDRVLFYPSACGYSHEFQKVPHDVVILNSNSFRTMKRRGKVCCLNYDNNALLGLLNAKRIQLSAILIIRDGCEEGGNYECAAKEGFFGRLLPVVADTFDYHRDHGPFPLDVPAQFEEYKTPDYLEAFIRKSAPLGEIRSFRVTASPNIERDLILGRVRVVVIRDSIWRDYDQSNLIVVKRLGSARWAIPNYLAGLSPNADSSAKVEFVSSSRTKSIQAFLQLAEERKSSRLSLIPIAGGRYEAIGREIEGWAGDYPEEIFLYHLNRDDFQYFKSLQTD